MNADVIRCPVCGSSSLRPRPFGYQFNGSRLEGIECLACKIIFVSPQPSPEDMARMYSKEYFQGDFRCSHEGSYFDDATLARIVDEELLRRIMIYKPAGKFLEIGCAGGAFLNAARNAGYEVRGVEFSDDAARFARDKFKLDVVTGDILNVPLPPDAYDVAFMGDVLEHLPDPVASLKAIHRFMKDRGLLVILCPMQTNTLYSRLGFAAYWALGRKATVHLPPYHLFEFRPGSIARLVRSCGFEVTRLGQSAIPPSQIAQRGTFLEKSLKKLFQYPNYLLTSLFRVLGDRVELYATKITEPSA
ncbi:MAG TPA: class I SAM-dependent methyltransferase [Bacteroidota bacterium]|nr:class I SAM-dependent methyltransferase [Bacteroidota bacterium]